MIKFYTGTNQFKLAAIVYPKVLAILRDKTDASHPLNVDEIIALIPEAKSTAQIYDCIRANKEHISSHREGKRKVFWWKRNGGLKKQFELDYLKPSQVNMIMHHELQHTIAKNTAHNTRPSRHATPIPMEEAHDKPDIYIGKDKIIITTGKVKITVDL